MKYLNVFICSTMIFSILVSCKPVKQETSNVLDQMCGNLCWNNIVIGSTTKEELLSTVGSLANVDQSSISEFGQEGLFDERIYFSFHNSPVNKAVVTRVSAYLVDQKVVALDLSDNLGASFQEVATEFGKPELVAAIKNHGGQVGISFINPSRGIFFSYVAKSEETDVTPETAILTITLFDVALSQELLDADWLIPGYKKFTLYPWNGYGKIEDLYWPPVKQ